VKLSASRLRIWFLVFVCCAAIVLVSTRISRETVLWGIAASALILAWLWSRLSRPDSPE